MKAGFNFKGLLGKRSSIEKDIKGKIEVSLSTTKKGIASINDKSDLKNSAKTLRFEDVIKEFLLSLSSKKGINSLGREALLKNEDLSSLRDVNKEVKLKKKTKEALELKRKLSSIVDPFEIEVLGSLLRNDFGLKGENVKNIKMNDDNGGAIRFLEPVNREAKNSADEVLLDRKKSFISVGKEHTNSKERTVSFKGFKPSNSEGPRSDTGDLKRLLDEKRENISISQKNRKTVKFIDSKVSEEKVVVSEDRLQKNSEIHPKEEGVKVKDFKVRIYGDPSDRIQGASFKNEVRDSKEVSNSGRLNFRDIVNNLIFGIKGNIGKARSSFVIRLHPPELGRVVVRMIIKDKEKVVTRFIVENRAVYDLLSHRMDILRSELKGAGVNLENSFFLSTMTSNSEGENRENGRNNSREDSVPFISSFKEESTLEKVEENTYVSPINYNDHELNLMV